MKKNRLVLVLALALVITGCGNKLSDKQKIQASKCLKKLDVAINWLEQNGYDKGIGKPTTVTEEENKIRHDWLGSLRYAKSNLQDGLAKSRLTEDEYVRAYVALGIDEACGPYSSDFESVDTTNRHHPRPIRKEWESKQLDMMNAEIDKALEKGLNDYRRKAVKHTVLSGPGPRVDQFVMRDGSIVHCVTTVKNAGKAVSCR